MFYVYHLIDPLTNVPFYIGKGKDDRMYDHEKCVLNGKLPNHNKFLYYKIKKVLRISNKLEYKKIYENLIEQDALKKEILEIKKCGFRKNGGVLCNLTDGGEGISGFKFNDKQRIKNREMVKKLWENPKFVEKYKNAMSKVDWIKVRKKQSESLKERFKDKKFLEAHKTRLQKINSTIEARERNSKRTKEFYDLHPEQKEKLSAIQKRLWQSGKYDNSKSWSFISPAGELINFTNLQEFCKINKLQQSNMINVSKGKRKHHKGWKSSYL